MFFVSPRGPSMKFPVGDRGWKLLLISLLVTTCLNVCMMYEFDMMNFFGLAVLRMDQLLFDGHPPDEIINAKEEEQSNFEATSIIQLFLYTSDSDPPHPPILQLPGCWSSARNRKSGGQKGRSEPGAKSLVCGSSVCLYSSWFTQGKRKASEKKSKKDKSKKQKVKEEDAQEEYEEKLKLFCLSNQHYRHVWLWPGWLAAVGLYRWNPLVSGWYHGWLGGFLAAGSGSTTC